MKVGAIMSYSTPKYSQKGVVQKKMNVPQDETVGDTVAFKGKGGKILGGVLGTAAGGAAGGAIIGGGTLAGMAGLAALGPVGIGLAAIYTIGGAVAGGAFGAEMGDIFSGDDDTGNKK